MKKKLSFLLLFALSITIMIPSIAFALSVTSGGVINGMTWNTDIDLEEKGVIVSGTFNGTVNHSGLIVGGTFNGAVNTSASGDFGLRLELSGLEATDLSYTGAEDYTHNNGTYANGVYTYKDVAYLVMPYHTEYSFTLSPASEYVLPNEITIEKNGAILIEGTDYTYDDTTGKVTIFAASVSCPMSLSASGHKHTHVYDKQVVADEYLAAPASCEKSAQYYCSCECGEKGTGTFSNGSPSGHNWKEPEWIWEDDYSSATAAFTCRNDASHTASIKADVVSETTAAAGTAPGQTVYTATADFYNHTYTDTKTVTIPAAGTEESAEPTQKPAEEPAEAPVQSSETESGSTERVPKTGDEQNMLFYILLAASGIPAIWIAAQKTRTHQ